MATEGGDYEWNMAFHTFRRLQVLLGSANEHRISDNFIMWFKCLDALVCEVSVYLNENNVGEKKILDQMDSLLDACYKGYKNYVVRKNNNTRMPTIPFISRMNLSKLHRLLLKVLENKKILLKKGKVYKPDVW